MWNNKVYFEGEEFDALLARVDAIAERLPEDWYLAYVRQDFSTIVFSFETPSVPRPDGYDTYLATHYASVSASSVPTVVACHSIDEAHYFLDRIEERLNSDNPTVDYEAVLTAAGKVVWEGLADQASMYSGQYDPASLPCTNCDDVYWMYEDKPNWMKDAETIITANWSYGYCHWGEIPHPIDEDEASLLIGHEGTGGGGESEVRLDEDDITLKDRWGVEFGSLEEFLWLQLFCWRGRKMEQFRDPKRWNDTSTYDRSQCDKLEYAAVRYDIVAGIWFRPVAENIQYFGRVLKNEIFKGYYNDYSRRIYRDGEYTEEFEPSEQEEAVWAWLKAARANWSERFDYDETLEHIDYWRVKWNDPTVDDEARENAKLFAVLKGEVVDDAG